MSDTKVDHKPKSSPSLKQSTEVSKLKPSTVTHEQATLSHKESNEQSESKQDDQVKETVTSEVTDQQSSHLPPTPPPTGTTSNKEEADDHFTNQSELSHLISHEDSEESGPLVDMETFGQLLEMDDDEEHSFSKSLTWDYFDQAVTTFKEMDAAVLGGDLLTLSRKGHFLKGSSAALGLNKVKASCEKMQHYGNRKKANGEGALSESEAMEKCKSLLAQLKDQQKLSKAWLERFYAERNV